MNSETDVVIAAPTAPKYGIKTKFKPIFIIAATVVAIVVYFSFPITMNN